MAAQQPAPDFALPLTDGSEAKLSELLQDKEDHGLSFMIGMKNESIDSLKVGGFPTTYIIDRNGNIVFSMSGAFQNGEEFEKIVTSLMGGDDGMVTYYTENAQELKVELLNLPEGYTNNADEIAVGMESGIKLITIEKNNK